MERRNYLMLLNIQGTLQTAKFLDRLKEATGDTPQLLWVAGDKGLAILYSSEH